ncbi:tetrapyrrole methylase family protein / MazG family protein [Halobacillus dabanensis]|uniref:Tetrapyrrole methylase family protein / MazG family protein n=1 Tax=Halobacillus dabanensis TaxID=240302 RepID=A0A1I4ANJ6_HALDA|nr:nucleoside triphosphate pyrophosphohydrolase [Halobacillus dabanensis]SFK57491.1 tetrapyrrole methylase family protein / MazG family protein [Halobacillus dabanensis]
MNTIKVLGLGAADLDQLPLGVYRKLKETESPLFVRTLRHPVVEDLHKEGITFESFDSIYESNQHFGDIYNAIVDRLLEASKEEDITYIVPGHPMLAERTVQLLLEKRDRGEVFLNIEGGQSFLDATFTALEIDPIEGFQFVDATDLKREQLQYLNHLILCQVYDTLIASEVKLTLLEDLPADHPITIVTAAGSKDEQLVTVPLEELDRNVEVNNLTSVYVPPVAKESLNHQFFRLREVIRILRSPEGCPWDRKQTHESLRKYMIEEAYEFIDAVNQLDDEHMVEELGDVLLQIMLHSQIGEEEGYFTIDDVIVSVTDKMIRRHPHVFGEINVETSDEVVANWDVIKEQEKGSAHDSILDSVPESFPALLQAEELQKKAAKVGFDWETVEPVIEKVEEEWQEFQEARESGDREEMEKEFGDWLFAIANLARHYKLSSENALQRTNRKFRNRLSSMEGEAQAEGRSLKEYDLDSLEELWVRAKAKNKGAE